MKCQRFLLTFFFSFSTDILFPYKKLHFRLKKFFLTLSLGRIYFSAAINTLPHCNKICIKIYCYRLYGLAYKYVI